MIATKERTQKTTTTRAPAPTSHERTTTRPEALETQRHTDGDSVPAGDTTLSVQHALRPDDRPCSRSPWKQKGANVKSQYGITLQIGFVLALSLLLGLTFLRFEAGDTFDIALSEQDVIVMEDVQQTEQEIRPPAPPRPSAPVEVANNVVLEDETFDFDATLDFNETLDVSGPPAPPEPEASDDKPSYEDEVFVVVEDKPELIGGLAGLQSQIEYPKLAQKAGIEGRVFIQFVVNENGDVINPTVIRGRHELLDSEALRVIRQAKFEPGRQRGKPVKVQLALPITFKLMEK